MENSLKKALVLFAALPIWVLALGEDPHVVAGHATFTYPDPQTQNIEAVDKTAVNFRRFNIGKHETVNVTSSKDATVLFRVTGRERSLIDGRLHADCNLVLINPFGMFFSEIARVTAGTLIVSALDISNEDFVSGKYQFFLQPDSQDSEIVNNGEIKADRVALLAPQIINRGFIKAQAENIYYLGAEVLTLSFEPDNKISFAIDKPLKKAGIIETGKISAPLGNVYIELHTAKEVISSVVNTTGLEQASAIVKEEGKIYLTGSIEAKNLIVKGNAVQKEGDLAIGESVKVEAQEKIDWKSGDFKRLPGTEKIEVELTAPQIALDAPFGDAKSTPYDILKFNGKIIDSARYVRAKSEAIFNAGEKTILRGNVRAADNVAFNGSVAVGAPEVKVTGGIGGTVCFNGAVDGAQPGMGLEVVLGKADSSSAVFRGPIGQDIPLETLKVTAGNAVVPSIGTKENPGVQHLEINVIDSGSIDYLGPVVHAGDLSLQAMTHNLKSGQPTSFITEATPIDFKPNGGCKNSVNLEALTSVSFETRGGVVELSELQGNNRQPVTINTGNGEAKIGSLTSQGDLKVQAQEIKISGKIDAGAIFMEAEGDIRYAVSTSKIVSKGDMILNSISGSLGSKELPLHVDAKGILYVGAKTPVHMKGLCAENIPLSYQPNPPPNVFFNGRRIFVGQPIQIDHSEREQKFTSLTQDLRHAEPHGFFEGGTIGPRHAPIYYQVE